MKKIKAILIGLGNIGFSCDLNKAKTFYSHSKVLNKLDFIDFVCGVDKDKKKLLEFKKIYKIDTSSNLEKSILMHEPNLIVVSVNTSNLFSILKKIAKHKLVQNVLVEKPGCANYQNLKEVIKIYKEKNINLFINYNRSYNQNIRKMFKKIKSNDYFKSVYFYNRGLLNNCSHFLNLIFLYLDLPKKITIINKGKQFKRDIQPDIKLQFNNGEIFFISNNNKDIIHNEFLLTNKKFKINSNVDFTELKKYKIIKNNLIKNNKSYLFESSYKIDKKKYQTNVYREILRLKNHKLINNIAKSSLKVLYFYNKLITNYRRI